MQSLVYMLLHYIQNSRGLPRKTEMPMLLSELKNGESAFVAALKIDGNMRRRLQDIGFVNNAPVKRVGTSPLGDPGVYLIKNALISVRKTDADSIVMSDRQA